MQKKNTQHKHIILTCLFGMQEVKLLYELTQRIICIDSGTEKTCFLNVYKPSVFTLRDKEPKLLQQ